MPVLPQDRLRAAEMRRQRQEWEEQRAHDAWLGLLFVTALIAGMVFAFRRTAESRRGLAFALWCVAAVILTTNVALILYVSYARLLR